MYTQYVPLQECMISSYVSSCIVSVSLCIATYFQCIVMYCGVLLLEEAGGGGERAPGTTGPASSASDAAASNALVTSASASAASASAAAAPASAAAAAAVAVAEPRIAEPRVARGLEQGDEQRAQAVVLRGRERARALRVEESHLWRSCDGNVTAISRQSHLQR